MLKRVIAAIIFVAYPLFVYPLTNELESQADLYREEGYRRQNSGDTRGALSAYLKAVHTCPLCREAYNDAGVAYETLGDLTQAEEMYKRAIDVDPEYLPPYANLGFLLEKKGDVRGATYYWKQRYLLGKQGEYWRQKAREHLIKLGTFPDARKEELAEEANVFSHNILVERETKRKQAIADSRQHFSLGNKAMAQGRYIEAEMQFSAILQLMPEDEELISQAKDQYAVASDYAARQRIKQHLEKAIHQLDSKVRDDQDYIHALEELKKAEALVPESARHYEYADQ